MGSDSPIATALPLQIISQELVIRSGDLAIAIVHADELQGLDGSDFAAVDGEDGADGEELHEDGGGDAGGRLVRVLDVRIVADMVRGGAGHHHGVAGGEDVGLVGADAHHLRVVVADGLQAGSMLICNFIGGIHRNWS